MINWKKRYAHRVLPWPFLPKEIESHLEIHHNGDIDYANLGDVVDAYRGIYEDAGFHKHMMFDEFLHGRHNTLHNRIETNHSHPNQASVVPTPKDSQLRLHIRTQHGLSSHNSNVMDELSDDKLPWFHDYDHAREDDHPVNHRHAKTAEKVFPKFDEETKNSYMHMHMHHGMPMSAIAEIHYLLTNESDQMEESRRLERLPNESPVDLVHRWVHEVRGGEWNLDDMGHNYDHHRHASKRLLPDTSGDPEGTRRHLKVEHGLKEDLINAMSADPFHSIAREHNESNAEFIHRLEHYLTDVPYNNNGARHVHVEREPGNIYTPDHEEYGKGFRTINTEDI